MSVVTLIAQKVFQHYIGFLLLEVRVFVLLFYFNKDDNQNSNYCI